MILWPGEKNMRVHAVAQEVDHEIEKEVLEYWAQGNGRGESPFIARLALDLLTTRADLEQSRAYALTTEMERRRFQSKCARQKRYIGIADKHVKASDIAQKTKDSQVSELSNAIVSLAIEAGILEELFTIDGPMALLLATNVLEVIKALKGPQLTKIILGEGGIGISAVRFTDSDAMSIALSPLDRTYPIGLLPRELQEQKINWDNGGTIIQIGNLEALAALQNILDFCRGWLIEKKVNEELESHVKAS
jgi:hypothetical protein